MTDAERFELVLGELRDLLLELYTVGLKDDAVLIGAQVVALEQRHRQQPAFELTLPTGLRVVRAFSFEPDLVLDTTDLRKLEDLPGALRRRGFERAFRAGKPSTWSKNLGVMVLELDLFTAELTEDEVPTPMTRLRGAPVFSQREIELKSGTSIKVPDPYAYLSLKLEAKLRIRPNHTKDSMDLFAYAHVVGSTEIALSLARRGEEGRRVRTELHSLFGALESPGVKDVLAAAGENMSDDEQALLARAVVDAFASLLEDPR